jgi:16S rRNA (cytidine1402-2'-O)-methyltransferase
VSSEQATRQPGRLFLVPNLLGDSEPDRVLPPGTRDVIRQITYCIAETPKAARAFLKAAGTIRPLQEIRVERIPDNFGDEAAAALLAPLLAGEDAGLISDAGCPAVADPGALVIRMAHAKNIPVVPLVGPSSILLALMASGLQGQRFAFHGYLPVDERQLQARVRELELESAKFEQTQIFIETPYRNERMLKNLAASLRPDTLLCVATDLTLHSEQIVTRPASAWRKAPQANLKDRPSVFLLLATRSAAVQGSTNRKRVPD